MDLRYGGRPPAGHRAGCAWPQAVPIPPPVVEGRDDTKYHRMVAFGGALPRIRRQVDRDMRRHALSRAKVVGAVVRLVDTTTIRVGNDEYVHANGSFGLTTLRDRHYRRTALTCGFDSAARGARCMTSISRMRGWREW